jgi:signal transduction histidine kinase
VKLELPLPRVLGHEAYLTQVLSNLLFNAVKFVPAGRRPEVRLAARRDPGQVRLTIQDNGIGIPREEQGRLFGMFERLTHDFEGTGIGLSIVRKAVERMGGEVGVDSEAGRGATFWIQLREAPAR